MNKRKKSNFVWGGIHPFSYHPFVFHFIPADLKNKLIVDCGCGKGIWGFLIRTTRDVASAEIVGIDINKEYLDFCKKFNIYNKTYNKSVEKLPFKDNRVNLLISSEVIEHLTFKKGQQFLKEVDRVMAPGGRAIITTPNLKIDTEIKIGADAHRSLWSVDNFKQRGYRVNGMGLKVSVGINKWYSMLILGLSHSFTFVSYKFPRLGSFLIAVKDF